MCVTLCLSYTTQATPPVVPMSHIEEPVRTPMRPPLPQEVDDSPNKGYEAAEPDDELTYDTAENVGPVESQDIYDDVNEQPAYPTDESNYDEIGETLQGMQLQEATPQGMLFSEETRGFLIIRLFSSDRRYLR